VQLDGLPSLKYFIPEMTLVLTFVFVLVWDLVLKGHKDRDRLIPLLAVTGLVLAGYFTLGSVSAPEGSLFSGMIALDPLGLLCRLIFISAAIIVTLLTVASRELEGVQRGEMYVFLLAVTLAMMWMAASLNLLMIYLALEAVSIGSYLMVGYLRRERLSNEASLKYVVFGAVSTGAMLYGMSFLFGLTGSLDLYEIRSALLKASTTADAGPALLFVVVLILAGIGFKVAAVPFHFWCPDVYTGAPTPVTAFLSVGPKVAGFAVLIRFFFIGMAEPSHAGDSTTYQMVGGVDWRTVLIAVSIATMTLGNVAALLQTNLKRLLAYSSMAHAGYILMGAAVLSSDGIQAMLAYMFIYLFMNLGVFLVVIAVFDDTGSFDLKDYGGIWKRSPYLTAGMGVFLLSLMGIPPFAGFLAKFYIFAAVIRAGLGWFAVIGVVNSAIAAFYYMKVLKVMFIGGGEGGDGRSLELHPIYSSLLFLLVVPNIIGLALWGYLDRLTEYSQRLLDIM
jgi:NADH-quinone oxidoreductase subunit N